MTWTKLSDDYADRLEDLELTASACWLHTAALIYCNRVGTDGRIQMSKLGKVSSIDAPELYAAELEQQGYWTVVEEGGAWQIDFSDQEPAVDVAKRREEAKVRQRRRRLHVDGDHTMCDPRRACRASVTRDESGRQVVTRDSQGESRPPVPSRPGPKEPGRGRCRHGELNGMGVTGDGDQASRICGRCEVDMPAVGRQPYLPPQPTDGRDAEAGS